MCPRGSCCGRQLEPRPEANQSTRFRQARRSCDGSPATIRGGGNPTLNMALAPRFRMGPPPRSSPPMRTSASWVRTHAVRRIQGCGALALPQGGLPSGRRCASRVPAPAQPLSANQHPEERPCSALDRSSPIQVRTKSSQSWCFEGLDGGRRKTLLEFLNRVLDGRYDDGQIEKLWSDTGTDYAFFRPGDTRQYLLAIRDELDRQGQTGATA